MESVQAYRTTDPRFRGLYERVSRRKGARCAVVAVAHEMARIIYFMLSRNEPYRGEDRGVRERKCLRVWEKKRLMACGTRWMLPGHRVGRR